MDTDNLGTSLLETLEELKAYVDNQITYNKLLLTKKAEELSSYLILFILLISICGFVLLFLSFAFAGWFDDVTDLGTGAGYLVVAGIYVVLGIIVFMFRYRLIFNPTRKLFGKIFFGEDESTNNSSVFVSSQSLADNIKEAHSELQKQQDILTEKLNDLGQVFTFANIANQLIGKAYSSVMTASNIASFAFNLVRKVRGFTDRRSRKKKKKLKQKDRKQLKSNKN